MDIDFLLLQRMKRGDENAFDVFVRKYYKEILNYCNYHCPDTSTAEDLSAKEANIYALGQSQPSFKALIVIM